MNIPNAVVIFALGAGLATPLAADARGDEVAAQYYGHVKPADTTADAVMTLIDKAGNKKVRELTMVSKDTPAGGESFIEFKKPADVAGTKFLTTPLADGTSEQRLYLPALKKVRKIASSDKSSEFVGSDLTYYDMQDRKLSDGVYTLLSEGETLADKAFEGRTFYKLEMKSKEADSPYSKSVVWIDKADGYAVRVDVFDKKDGSLWKSIVFVKYEEQKGVKMPVQTLVTNFKKGSKTLLELKNLKVNTGVSDAIFSVKNLEQ